MSSSTVTEAEPWRDVEVIDFEENGAATRRVAPGVYHVIAILGDPLDEGETRWQQAVVIEPDG